MKTRCKTLLPLTLICLAAVTLLLTGCGAPTSRGLIGNTPKQLEPAEWNGHWRSDGDTYVVRVADAEGGLLEITDLQEKDGALELSTMHLYVREEGAATLFNLIDPTDPAQTYTFGRLVRKNSFATFWPCRTEAMDHLIGRGLITGHITVRDKTKEVLVTGGYDVLARQLADPQGWQLLQMDEPFTMLRERTDF